MEGGCRRSHGQIGHLGTFIRVKRINVSSLIFRSVLGFRLPYLMSLSFFSLFSSLYYRNAITALGYEVHDVST